MTDTATQWRLDILAHADRMTDVALDQTHDMNEAKFLVHGVIARAMADIEGRRRDLDTDLGRALRRRAEKIAV